MAVENVIKFVKISGANYQLFLARYLSANHNIKESIVSMQLTVNLRSLTLQLHAMYVWMVITTIVQSRHQDVM